MRRFRFVFACFFAATLTTLLFVSSPGFAQESATPDEAATADEAASDDDAAEAEEKPSALETIQSLIKAGKPAEAAKALDEALAETPDDPALNRQRAMVAMSFMRIRDYSSTIDQFGKLLDYQLTIAETPADASAMAATVQQMSMFGARGGQAKTIAVATERAIARCREIEAAHPIAIQDSLSRLLSARVVALSQTGDMDAAKQLIAPQVEKLENINASDDGNESTMAALINLMLLASQRLGDDDADARVSALMDQAMEKYEGSDAILNLYGSSELSAISGLLREDPEAAAERMEAAKAKLEPYAEKSRSVAAVLRRFDSLQSRLESARKQQEMIGKPAPALEIDAWANAEGMDVESLKGKVVLYDFWAVWCGPCIATFPHLREWREEFGDQGFEIVGITRYYGYSWNEEQSQAVRSQEEVSPEAEQEAIAKFLQSKDMQHPTIFTPKESELQKAYGVTGIPHAVLVDREGNVQMIKVGSGEANANALHEKIQELLAK